MALIDDGTGNGFVAKVDSRNRLLTSSITQSSENYSNTVDGQAYHVVIQETPSGPNQTFFFLRNTSTNNNIIFEGFDYRVAAPEVVEIYKSPAGVAVDGTTLDSVNANTGSAKSLSATIESGVNITGFTNGTLFDRIYMTSTETKNFNFNVDLIIAPGGIFLAKVVNGSIQVDMVLQCYEGARL